MELELTVTVPLFVDDVLGDDPAAAHLRKRTDQQQPPQHPAAPRRPVDTNEPRQREPGKPPAAPQHPAVRESLVSAALSPPAGACDPKTTGHLYFKGQRWDHPPAL